MKTLSCLLEVLFLAPTVQEVRIIDKHTNVHMIVELFGFFVRRGFYRAGFQVSSKLIC